MGATQSNEQQRGSRRKNGLRDVSGEWKGFVDISLTGQEKEHLASLEQADYPDITAFLENVLSDGYKFSVTRDELHSCVIATLTGKGKGCPNAGYSLSARGPDLVGALLVLHHKHVVICEQLRWAEHGESSERQLSLWG